MKINITSNFQKDVAKVEDINALKKLKEILKDLEKYDMPELYSKIKILKLEGYNDYYRIRVGKYRIGAQIHKDTMILMRFLPRKIAYRFFPPKS